MGLIPIAYRWTIRVLTWEDLGTMPNPPLPKHLVESFKVAYRTAFGHDIPDELAEAAAWRTLDVLMPIVKLHARILMREK